jgi:hypothetical protein
VKTTAGEVSRICTLFLHHDHPHQYEILQYPGHLARWQVDRRLNKTARHRVTRSDRTNKASFLSRVQQIRVDFLQTQARAALAAAEPVFDPPA